MYGFELAISRLFQIIDSVSGRVFNQSVSQSLYNYIYRAWYQSMMRQIQFQDIPTQKMHPLVL